MTNRYKFESNGGYFEVLGKFGKEHVFCVTAYPFTGYIDVSQGTPTGSIVRYAVFNVPDKETLTEELSKQYGNNISLQEF